MSNRKDRIERRNERYVRKQNARQPVVHKSTNNSKQLRGNLKSLFYTTLYTQEDLI